MEAKIQIAAVFADCPECNGALLDDLGSTLIPVVDYSSGKKFKCEDCGKEFKLEIKAWR